MKSLLADSGYVGQPFAQAVKQTLGEPVTAQIAKRSELHKFAVIPKRWGSANASQLSLEGRFFIPHRTKRSAFCAPFCMICRPSPA